MTDQHQSQDWLSYAVSKKRHRWETILEEINAGIDEFETSGLMIDIIQKADTDCDHPVEETLRPYTIQNPEND